MTLSLPQVDLEGELHRLWSQVPPGKVTTYGSLAERLGDRVAARWVAEYSLNHSHSPSCACHRVILRTGATGQWICGSSEEKQRILEAEGIRFKDGRIDGAEFEFQDFAPSFDAFGKIAIPPLQQLRRFQDEIAARFIEAPVPAPAEIGAVDLAYGSGGEGVAALAVIDLATRRLLRSEVLRRPVAFPYITGYLAFREVGLLIDLLGHRTDLPPVLFVDGNGRLHPRRAGIATTLGVLLDHPTVGIGKKLLCGKVDLEGLRAGESRDIVDRGERIGAAVRGRDDFHPIFVSPGHRCDLESAVRLTQPQFAGHRLPESVFQADRLSKQAARS